MTFDNKWLDPSIDDLKINTEFMKAYTANNYDECIKVLINKYGSVPYDYYIPKHKSKTRRTGQQRRGLQMHHIREDSFPNLASCNIIDSLYAYTMQEELDIPIYETILKYQKAEYLVYANIFEHIALHNIVTKQGHQSDSVIDTYKALWNSEIHVGIGGVCALFIQVFVPIVLTQYHKDELLTKSEMKQVELYTASKNEANYILGDSVALIRQYDDDFKLWETWITNYLLKSAYVERKQIINEINNKVRFD